MIDQSALWVVWSFEHRGWWRPGGYGYTPDLACAGRYSEAEARAIEAHANIVHLNEQAVPVTQADRMFTCPRCGAASFNPHDLREQYCGRCHLFVEHMTMQDPVTTQTLTPDEIAAQQDGAVRIAPGLWLDREGNPHWSIPELLALVDLEDTPANREAICDIIARSVPNDAELIRQEPKE